MRGTKIYQKGRRAQVTSPVMRKRLSGMQLRAKRAVDARAILLLEKRVVQDSVRLVRSQVSGARKRLVWTQIPQLSSFYQMAKCDSVHWQFQQSPSRFVPETGVEKVKRKWLQRSQVFAKLGSKFSYCVQMCVCILRFQKVFASVFVDSNCCALVLASMSYDRKMNSVFTCIF